MAIEGRSKTASGKPETISRFVVDLYRSDTCTFQSLVIASGSANLPPEAFQVNKELTAASLQATVQACDYLADDNCVSRIPVEVNLTWTGTGEIQRNKSVSHANDGGCHFNFRTMGDTRVAVATGRISALGLNFTPESSSIADLSSGKDASATINCP